MPKCISLRSAGNIEVCREPAHPALIDVTGFDEPTLGKPGIVSASQANTMFHVKHHKDGRQQDSNPDGAVTASNWSGTISRVVRWSLRPDRPDIEPNPVVDGFAGKGA